MHRTLTTYQIEAPRRKLAAESERKLAEDWAAAEARAATEKLKIDRMFAILQDRVRQLRTEYANAVRENNPQHAGELLAEIMSYAPRPPLTRQQAIDAAREDCQRIQVYQQLEAAAILRNDSKTAQTIHEAV